MRRIILFSRVVAVAVCAPLAALILFNAEYRSDNIFAVPDLIGCAVLLTAAFLPARRAQPVFAVGFGYMAGVITVATFGRLDNGDTANVVLNGVIVVVFAALAISYARRGK
jgi:hypothetical protein